MLGSCSGASDVANHWANRISTVNFLDDLKYVLTKQLGRAEKVTASVDLFICID